MLFWRYKVECRGTVILGYFKYIKKTWGAGGVDKCTTDLKIELDNIKEGKWYDIQYSELILQWINDNKGPEFVIKAGTHTVKDQGMFSYIVRFANIKSILKRAQESHKEVFKTGSMKVSIRDNSATIKMTDTAISDYSCLAWKGCFIGTLEMTNTKGTVNETQCQRKDASNCVFEMEWE